MKAFLLVSFREQKYNITVFRNSGVWPGFYTGRLHLTTSANCMLNIIACWTMDLSVVCCKVGWGTLEQNFFHVALKAVPLAFCGYLFVGNLSMVSHE